MNLLLWVLLGFEIVGAIALAAAFFWVVKVYQQQSTTAAAMAAKQEAKFEEREAKLEQQKTELTRERESLQSSIESTQQDKLDAIRTKAEADELVCRAAAITPEQAKEIVIARAADSAKTAASAAAAQIIKDAEQIAKRTILEVMERTAADYVSEASITVVQLPNEDMKGRLIGKEGRNIRSFEQITGTDLIIDETPSAVVISCFDPMRREIAVKILEALVADGRIQPIRIEEEHAKAQKAVQQTIPEAGHNAARKAGITGLPPKVIEMMGGLRFRTSYGQNVLDHSIETAQLAHMIAAELGFNADQTKKAAFLHDIGKALPDTYEGPHALTGMQFLADSGVKEPILTAVGAHHREIEPVSPEAEIVIIADTISASRPGARKENLENYTKRLKDLEALADQFPGVERSYAVQAGRELRVIAKSSEVDDAGIAKLAKELAKAIEAQTQIPGQVKVTVIREMRAEETAG